MNIGTHEVIAPKSFSFEVLTAAELDYIAGAGAGDGVASKPGSGNSQCVSACHIDGNNEEGTS